MLIDFDVDKYDGNAPIVIWGTELIGGILYHGLEKKDIVVSAFADSIRKEAFCGKQIVMPEDLSEWYRRENIIILIGVTAKRKEIENILKELKIERYYDAWNFIESLVEEDDELQKASFQKWQRRESYLMYKWQIHNPQKLWIRSVDLVITEKCSLKCRDCSNLMQYYKHPVNFDLEILKEGFDKFLDKVDRIGELRIIGGEPLMHPEFYKIVQWYKNCNKIGKIGVWSNGTIFPSEEVREVLNVKKLWIRFSDYGQLSYHLSDWIEYCKEENICYEVIKMNKWHDLGELEKRNCSEETLKNIYQCCQCRNLPTFLNGRLYNCPYAANADNLRAMQQKDAVLDFIDFSNENIDYTTADIKSFLEDREYLMACDYCSGRNFEDGEVEPYIQVKEPLTYVSYE